MSREDSYRLLDAVFRVHEDLFQIEDALLRTAIQEAHISRILTQGRLGAAVAGTLAIVPIIVSVSGLDWASAPIIWFVLIAAGLVAVLSYQAKAASDVSERLRLAEKHYKRTPLSRRLDYTLEQITGYVTRVRILDEVLEDLTGLISSEKNQGRSEKLTRRRDRWTEIRRDCITEVESILGQSEVLVTQGVRTDDQHRILLDWAAPALDAYESEEGGRS